jgi:hypothetical protein
VAESEAENVAESEAESEAENVAENVAESVAEVLAESVAEHLPDEPLDAFSALRGCRFLCTFRGSRAYLYLETDDDELPKDY